MNEQDLIALVRTALLTELPEGVRVLQKNNPKIVGTPSAPTIYIETIIPAQRVGWVSRQERRRLGLDAFDHEELQWLETTLQISALARLRDGEPSAADHASMAADILQGDAGMAVLAAQRVRPLRVTTSRTVYFLNDSQQYEANPSFDIVLSHVQIRSSTTPRLETIRGTGAPM
jgi:hypothetical protein